MHGDLRTTFLSMVDNPTSVSYIAVGLFHTGNSFESEHFHTGNKLSKANIDDTYGRRSRRFVRYL